jgi:S-adenosylmethionine:tRNA ribosyltransferase-isomerase
MQITDFDYELPEQLIARYPLPERSHSRLLHFDSKSETLADRQFRDVVDLIQPNDCLIFNNTKVMPARIYAQKPSGGKVEILLERLGDNNIALAHVKASKSPKPGSSIILADGTELQVLGREGDLFILQATDDWLQIMQAAGEMPLPPYMARGAEQLDEQRYQTVYAQHLGAVAAPTAGLHFDQELLAKLNDKGIRSAEVTLHVGAGTFQPVRVENIQEHQMHKEWLQVDEPVCELIRETKQSSGRVIAVGTTSVRSLETAARGGELQAYTGDSDIFIYPGYKFQVVDAMITNFHLPKSTLIMLVGAFSGLDNIKHAYQHAIEQEYRFFSYGDAMFLS